jgi:glycosyltransferase involved in cell wall biosynthesis
LLINDKQKAIDMGISGRRLVQEKYIWDKIAERIEECYKEVR